MSASTACEETAAEVARQIARGERSSLEVVDAAFDKGVDRFGPVP